MGKMIVDQSTISLAGMLLASALLGIGAVTFHSLMKDEFNQSRSCRNWLKIVFRCNYMFDNVRSCIICSLFDVSSIVSARRSS